MVDNIKRAQDSEDHISFLPVDVIYCILSLLPIQDSARTSILSRNWRYLWSSCPRIVLDRQFSQFLSRNRLPSKPKFVDVVNKILLQRVGPVSRFALDLVGVHIDDYTTVDQWIMFLSRNGVKDLTLNNFGNVTYSLPHCIFSCQERRSLFINNCSLKLPYPSQGFRNLYCLQLKEVGFSENAGCHVLDIPNLIRIILWRCSYVHYLKLHAPSLQYLCFILCDTAELSSLLVFKKLQVVHVSHSGIKMRGNDFHPHHLPELCSSWPGLLHLQLNRFLHKNMDFMASRNWMALSNIDSIVSRNWMALSLSNLPILYLSNFNSTSMRHVAHVMKLFRGIPDLSTLRIDIKVLVRCNPSPAMKAVVVEEYLESPGVMNQHLLKKLKAVDFRDFTGSRTELIMVKFLLSSSPSLEEISIRFLEGKSTDRSKILQGLVEFPRASPRAKVKLLN